MTDTFEEIRTRIGDALIQWSTPQDTPTLVVTREGLLPTLAFLRNDQGFDLPLDVTAVDLLAMADGKPEHLRPARHPMFHTQSVPPLGHVEGYRFEVVYHLRRIRDGALVRVKVPVREDDCQVPTATGVYPGLEWFEREVFDMFGVRFDGHPDLRRILLYPEFVGHPLRKDYPRRAYQPRVPMPNLQGDPVPGAPGPLPLGEPQEYPPPPTAQVPLEDGLRSEPLVINMGPSHPAMHGTVRIRLVLDGETVRDADIDIGYLHRGFEKMCEAGTWTQVIPYTDRLNYVSPLINNVGYVSAVEKLLGVQVTERCQYVRVFISEIARIADHLTAIGAQALEIGAYTPFLWAMQAREEIYFLIEFITGARVTTSYTRVGGLRWDLPEGWQERWQKARQVLDARMLDIDALLTRNRIFIDRMQDTGVIGPAEALALGFTGPCLRATGVAYDLRKDLPYLVYDRLDFEVPVGTRGDNLDRYLVRMEEIRQSESLVEQVIRDIPEGPVNIDDWRVVLPPKDQVYNTIEGMIAHFEIVMDGIQVPRGEAYAAVEGGNGEVGFYIVSDGSGFPYRVHVRPPCFALMQGLKRMIVGGLVADVIPTFDSINMIGGEIDR